jgi:hypothetical protein
VIEKKAINKFQLSNGKKRQKQTSAVSSHEEAIDSIKTGVNEMLDISKQAYSDTINLIQKVTIKLQRTLLKNLKLNYSQKLGYHYSVKTDEFEEKINSQTIRSLGIVIVGRMKHIIRFRTKVSSLITFSNCSSTTSS